MLTLLEFFVNLSTDFVDSFVENFAKSSFCASNIAF